MGRVEQGLTENTPPGGRRARPRIRFVTRKWPPALGGMETYSLRLSEALAVCADVETIALPGRESGAPPRAGALIGWGLKTAWRLVWARAPVDATLVGDMASWPLALAAGRRGGALALAAHGTDVAYPLRGGLRGRAYGAWLRFGARMLRGRAVVIANSQATADLARAHGFARAPVVALATDMRPPEPRPDMNAGTLLFAGRLTPRKGCAWFIREALDQLPGAIRLRVAGSVWDADERAALDHPRVDWLGALDQARLAREYAAALAVIIPNIDVPSHEIEGFGLVAAEAAAAGGLPLAARHSGLREAVVDGVTGFLLPPGDAAAWAVRIAAIAAWPPETRAGFLARGGAAARARFSWDRVARETLAALGLECAVEAGAGRGDGRGAAP